MIIELVGLPGAGKTTLASAMAANGAVLVRGTSRARLLLDAALFWILRPILAVRLLACILMRAPSDVRYTLLVNGYLGYAAHYHRARALSRSGATVVLDQGFFQLYLSLSTLPFEFLKAFPRPDVLAVVNADSQTRESRMASRGWAPREESGIESRLAWLQDAEESLASVLPAIEKLVHVYRYDGAQDTQKGAVALMEFAAEQKQTLTGRKFFKTSVAVASFLISQCSRIFSRTPQVVVLMYHAIDRSCGKLSVTPEEFERQISYLSRNGWAVPLADIVSYVKREKNLSSRVVAVTFDDGYRDLLTTVLPILERHHVSATVFIPSDLSARTDPSGTQRLNEEELRMFAQSPLITVGSHARTHRKFTELSAREMSSESSESANELERITGERPGFFAYPFGARSQEAEQAVRDAGYEAAFSITEGTILPGDDLFHLKRVQVDSTMSFLLFRLRLTSAVDWNRRIVDSFRAMMSL